MTKENIKLFFKSAVFTAVCLCCVAGIYVGCCRAYEEMRSTCFCDDRGAVIIGDGYIKFFDFELFF